MIKLISILYNIYFWMILIRLIGSWFPNFASTPFMRFIGYYTDPYLKIFSKFIPPIGGTIDISPILAIFALQLVKLLLISLFS